ncbi:hypothetical protein L596_022285 [Steinernema carpocapsae]|uniref:Uncharacterized protein n=1 Tax=Steinernema carpocapsae TaxID=34508 RepID=A0A4U5ML95_STECR|nr:hypothetical protein L596_022285 [Steinernema carpocapsae]
MKQDTLQTLETNHKAVLAMFKPTYRILDLEKQMFLGCTSILKWQIAVKGARKRKTEFRNRVNKGLKNW